MLTLLFLVLALVCFLLAALQVPSPRINLVALGLFFWALITAIGAGRPLL